MKARGARCVQCGKAVREDGELVCLRPNGEEEWLCGRPKCEADYNDDVPPRGKR